MYYVTVCVCICYVCMCVYVVCVCMVSGMVTRIVLPVLPILLVDTPRAHYYLALLTIDTRIAYTHTA
jgi:hypothetical protein